MPVYKVLVNGKIKEINAFVPAGWQFVTSASTDVSVAIPALPIVSWGLSSGSVMVRVTQGPFKKQQAGKAYRLHYKKAANQSVGIATRWPGTVNHSEEPYDCGAMGQVMRMPGSPNAAGEGGPPTGFLGPFSLQSVGGAWGKGRSVCTMLLGSNTSGPNPADLSGYKYIMSFWGDFLGVPQLGYSVVSGSIDRIEQIPYEDK